MATAEKILNHAADAELPHGTVSACTPEDRAALTDLYRAVYPCASPYDLAADIRDAETTAWAAYRDKENRIRLAMFVRADGVVWLLARPEECESPAVRHGFLLLAREARSALAPYGVRDLVVVHAVSLQPLARLLEREGFLSKETAVVRSMHFDEAGEITRTN